MPRKRRGKTKSEAWKQIVKDHKRGPKRVRMKTEPSIEEDDTILTQNIQLIIDKGKTRKHIIIKISENAIKKLRLRKIIKLLPNQTKTHNLYPALHALDHNALVMGQIKSIPLRINTYCGPYVCEALVYGGKIKEPKIIIHITNTKEEEEQMMKTDKYVQSLFSIRPVTSVEPGEVEYM